MVARRRAVWWDGKRPLIEQLRAIDGFLLVPPEQELSGDVANVINVALALGRNVSGLEYADYTPGAGWSDLGSEIARCTAGTSNFTQQFIPRVKIGDVWEVTYTVSNYVGGTVNSNVGGNDKGANRSADDTYVDLITITNPVTPTTMYFQGVNFSGDIDLKTVTLKQTGILESEKYPGAEVVDNPGNPFTFTADNPDDWASIVEDANREIGEVAQGQLHANIGTPGGGNLNMWRSGGVDVSIMTQAGKFTPGLRYQVETVVDGAGSGRIRVQDSSGANRTDIDAPGIYVSEETAIGAALQVFTIVDPTDITIKSIRVTPANPYNGLFVGMELDTEGMGNMPRTVTGDGGTTYIDLGDPITEFNSAFPIGEGSIVLPFEATPASWKDSTLRYLIQITADAGNQLSIAQSATDDTLIFQMIAGGTDRNGAYDVGALGFTAATITWDSTATRFYIGRQLLATLGAVGTWNANIVSAILAALNDTPTNVFDGRMGYLPLIYTRAFELSDVANMMDILGVSG